MTTIRPYKSASLIYKRNRRLCLDTISSPSSHRRDGTPNRYPITRIVIPNLTSTVVANGSQQSLTGSDLTQGIPYDGKEEENFDRDVDAESISSPRTQHHESLEKVTGRYAGISHLKIMHELDQPVSLTLVHGLEFNNHAGVSQHSIAPSYLPNPGYSHYLVNDLDRAAMLEYNILICESIMKNAGQQFPKKSLRPDGSLDVENVPFQTLQMLSNFLQDRYLELLEPRQNYGQAIQFFYHANKQLKATLALFQAWLPSTSRSSLSYPTIHPTLSIHEGFYLMPTNLSQEIEPNYTSGHSEHVLVYQNASGLPYGSSNRRLNKHSTNYVDSLLPVSSVNLDVVNGQMGSFDRPANYHSNTHASGNRTSAAESLNGTCPVQNMACIPGKIGATCISKFKELYKCLGRFFLPPSYPGREAEPRDHANDLPKNYPGSEFSSPVHASSYLDESKAAARHFNAGRATVVSVANPPAEPHFFKNGKVTYSRGGTNTSIVDCFKIPFRNYNPDLLYQ
ncbi:hypothetical protein Agabi119p4_2554 [Agaricus bisporus var. burnettii]|uniref:Uncharacterized protein n=1 Tax=Agaricus bisporus var. burnettii TaxID=192524 RepID=A0A8H7F9E2_AGABI|nr:hypothetical protein Agabi119p4_2554 [Agaricus bisporus var. burnettii]